MKRVAIIQTGGTILMRQDPADPGQVVSDPNAAAWLLREVPDLSGIADIRVRPLFNLDSSNIGAAHWSRIAEAVRQETADADGVVIVHGTDTMAFTASALSFALRGLGKPVILTGSQVPLAVRRSDARRNLVNAVEVATLDLPVVAVCFNDLVFRGNRVTKMSIGEFDAFASPNHPPLARIGLDIKITDGIRPETGFDEPLAPSFDESVHILKIHPAIRPERLASLPDSGLQALIIEAFGSGNFPIAGPHNLLPVFRACADAGMHLIIASQAPYDAIQLHKYESGRQAEALGMISAGDMTVEAALTKSMYLLAHPEAFPDFRSAFLTPLCGERS
jgi:L-asparaginase